MAFRETFKSVSELEKAVDKYFKDCDKHEELYGEAGLALALKVSLHTLRNWYDGETHPEFSDAIQTAYLKIQNQIETSATYREKGMPTMAIFKMKQSRLGGYTDKGDGKQGVTVNVKIGENVDKSDFM